MQKREFVTVFEIKLNKSNTPYVSPQKILIEDGVFVKETSSLRMGGIHEYISVMCGHRSIKLGIRVFFCSPAM